MFGMKAKDLALVAFAGGLLAVEMVGLRRRPRRVAFLAGVTGMPLVQSAARTARVATQSMVNGFTDAAAQAAVGGIESVAPGAFCSAIPAVGTPAVGTPAVGTDGTAERVAAATSIRVARTAPHARVNCSYRYLMVVRGASGAAAADARLAAWQSAACRAQVRAILAVKRVERAQERVQERAQKRAEAAHQAITTVSEASSL
jgi:hypothetical protein